MQVGRVYKLILFVLVFIVIAVVVMWGRGAGDVDIQTNEEPSLADLDDSGMQGAVIDDTIDLLPETGTDEGTAPLDIIPENPYAQANTDDADNGTMDSGEGVQEDEFVEVLPEQLEADNTPVADNSTVTPATETEDFTDLPAVSKKHIVSSGETLERIARKEYGKGHLWRIIADANSLTESSVLKVGQVLVIPPVKDDNSTARNTTPAGNPDSASSSTAEEATPANGKCYKVMAGDTLQTIAYKHYRSHKLWRKIASANNLSESSILKIGQRLVIPELSTAETPVTPSATEERTTPNASNSTPSEPVSNGKSYIVKKGDNLWLIAKKMYGDGSRWKEIYNANKNTISASKRLKIGQVLVIPGNVTVSEYVDNASKEEESENKSNDSSSSSIPEATQTEVEEVYNFFEE